MKKAVFFDRDGVIIELPKGNEAYGFTLKKEDVRILPNVPEALDILKQEGFLIIIVTNQPAIARGIARCEEVEELHRSINESLGGRIDRFYFCPHHPEMHPDVPEHARKYRIACECRKPAPGMLLEAARDFDIDLKKSWMIGDMITDIAAGEAAGCNTVMIESAANERTPISAKHFNRSAVPTARARDVMGAVKYIQK